MRRRKSGRLQSFSIGAIRIYCFARLNARARPVQRCPDRQPGYSSEPESCGFRETSSKAVRDATPQAMCGEDARTRPRIKIKCALD